MFWRLPLFACGLAAALASAWCWSIQSAFWRNAANADIRLFALWLIVHWIVGCGALLLLSLLLARPLRGILRRRAATIVSMLCLLTLPASFSFFSLTRFVSEPALAETQATVSPSGPILLLGLDGLDPTLMNQLIDAGALPNFARLRDEGCFGSLSTVSPHSPVVWSSIATGATPQMHGVSGYTSDYLFGHSSLVPTHERDRLGRWLIERYDVVKTGAVSSDMRRQKAIWEVLAEYGQNSLSIGWWASYPTTPGAGIQISNRAVPWDRFGEAELQQLDRVRGLVEPRQLWPRVREQIATVVHARHAAQLDRDNSRYFATRDAIHWSLFEHLRAGGQSLASVYLQELDTASHAYTHAVFGGNTANPRPMRVAPERAQEMFQQSVIAAYRRMDLRLGELLAKLGSDESVMIVSDHGWRYDGSGHWAEPAGAILCYGPAFAGGTRIAGASVFDVLPTLAALCGLPRSDELPGRVLTECLANPALATNTDSVPSYGSRVPGAEIADRGDDEAHLEQLRALGYIE